LAEVVVVGMGYVGLTSALGLTKIGHRVMGVDVDLSRLSLLKEGKLPIYEPGLEH
jgi:UDPglucose 6-dehydrogenase